MSNFYPLPKTMPFRAKAELMVKRGEARDYGHACSIMSSRKRTTPKQQQQQPQPRQWLPYKDNNE